MTKLTDKQAYAAMFHFIEQVYKRISSDDLAGLLGSMALLDDGSPADPAITHDWQEAVEYALEGGGPVSLQLE